MKRMDKYILKVETYLWWRCYNRPHGKLANNKLPNDRVKWQTGKWHYKWYFQMTLPNDNRLMTICQMIFCKMTNCHITIWKTTLPNDTAKWHCQMTLPNDTAKWHCQITNWRKTNYLFSGAWLMSQFTEYSSSRTKTANFTNVWKWHISWCYITQAQ